MRIVVIGGSGHIGSFLVPRLVRAGHTVFNITRGVSSSYSNTAPEWKQVQQVSFDRASLDAEGRFGEAVLALQPEVVIDLVCFTLESAKLLVDSLRGKVSHLIHCGSIWRYGSSYKLPISEDAAFTAEPEDEYGIEKAKIAEYLKQESARGGLVTTSIHPGHIVGPGWHPVGPLGNLNPDVWKAISAGEVIKVPGIGVEMMHHVHADDLALAFELAVANREVAAGEDFNIVSPRALNVRGFLQIASEWFGQELKTISVSWEDFRQSNTEEDYAESWEHLERSHAHSIEKAKRLLGYAPRYESDQAVLESVRWLIEHGEIEVPNPLVV
ncbi:MAG: NAD(P)-dependent oxidoreductase [Microbacteriaceae bacterium]|nr:NAD(P)-dependent oxidoreductase [Microbacteriaceae bacterium]